MSKSDFAFTPRAEKVIAYANDEVRRLGHKYIGTEHLLLGLIREGPREGFDLLAEAEKRLTLARIEYKKRAGAWGMVLDECRELENLLKNTYRLYP